MKEEKKECNHVWHLGKFIETVKRNKTEFEILHISKWVCERCGEVKILETLK